MEFAICPKPAEGAWPGKYGVARFGVGEGGMRAEGVERAKGGRGAVHGSGGGVVEVVVEVVVMVVVMMAVVVVVLGAHGGIWPINVHFLHDEMLHAEHLLEVPIGTVDIMSWRRRRWRWRHGTVVVVSGGSKLDSTLGVGRGGGFGECRFPANTCFVHMHHVEVTGGTECAPLEGTIHTLAALAVMPIRRRRGRGSARALGGDGSTKHPPGRCGGYTRTRR